MSSFKFGYATEKITPEVPVSLAGYFNIRMWNKVLDDLYVRTLLFEQDGKYSGIVQFDLVKVTGELTLSMREAISNIKEITPELLAFTATHTHTAPEIMSQKPGSNVDYDKFVVKKTVTAIKEAMANMKEGEFVQGKCEDDRFLFNRRYWMKDGTVVTNPGKLNPEIKEPEGKTDPEIPLLGIKENGKLKVLLCNIVNHTDTTGGCEVSADWAGFTRRELESKIGDNSMVMPLIGCAGNINHFDNSTDMDQTNDKEAERIGKGYAETISKELDKLLPCKNQSVSVANNSVEVLPREISEEEIEEAKAIAEKYADLSDKITNSEVSLTSEDLANKTPLALKYFADNLLLTAKDKDKRKFELIGMQLGDVRLFTLPGEPFVEIGLEIKEKCSADHLTFVVSHTNGSTGESSAVTYIPNKWNYGRGGYETQPRSNPTEMATAEKLVKTVNAIANKLS
jgi:hypothetical protein